MLLLLTWTLWLQFPADFFNNFNSAFDNIAAGSGNVAAIGAGNQAANAVGSGNQNAFAAGTNGAQAVAVSGGGECTLVLYWSGTSILIGWAQRLI